MEPRTAAASKWKIALLLLTLCVIFRANAAEEPAKKTAKKIGKNVLDMTDADMEMLLDQWEVGFMSFLFLDC